MKCLNLKSMNENAVSSTVNVAHSAEWYCYKLHFHNRLVYDFISIILAVLGHLKIEGSLICMWKKLMNSIVFVLAEVCCRWFSSFWIFGSLKG